MNRRFRLAALERLRAGALAEAARALELARRDVASAIAQRDKLTEELLACTAPKQAAPYELETVVVRRARLREDLGRAGERVAVAQGRELAAAAAWNAARSDLRAVETLHERHRLDVAAADARAEQRLTDELAASVRRPDPGGDS